MGADPATGAGVGGDLGRVLAPTAPLLPASLGAGAPEGADRKVEIGPRRQVFWGLLGGYRERERAVQETPY